MKFIFNNPLFLGKRKAFVSEYGDFFFQNKKALDIKKAEKNNFITDKLDLDKIIKSIFLRYNLGWKGPHTHIISLTRKCFGKCSYCAVSCKPSGKDMSWNTARKTIDFIFSIPREEFFIEFTGGEPVLNFKVLKKSILYAKEKAKRLNKKVYISVVTSLAYENKDLINFFIKENITVCSSLDGPKGIHDKNRFSQNNKSAFDLTVKNIIEISAAAKKGLCEYPNLISTITKDSLGKEREIADSYLKLGVKRIQLGMLEPLGRAYSSKLYISAKEYFDFYKKAVKHILKLNEKYSVYEKGLFLIVYDILKGSANPKRSLDIFHRLAYDFEGNIYPSDEARILGENGDTSLAVGNIYKDSLNSVLKKPETRFFLSYNLNNYLSPFCARCPYSLWCRVPIYYNYFVQNSIWGNMVNSERCEIMKSIFNFAFYLLSNKKTEKILKKWVEEYV
ncbi:MAG: 4Fe-4S cluster-binding domain-containing protein [Elusimicrobia bacterium]|nr:4Fe-4S cluster-binding domain-containing protein [Elusimicrobiota bacterium]